MILAALVFGLVSHHLTVSDMRCESVVNPLNVDVAHPFLSWVVSSPEEDQVQTAYRVVAGRSRSALAQDHADLWDSGKVRSSATLEIAYEGEPLASTDRVYWKVAVWDVHGVRSAWSDVGTWTMGLLHAADWKAKWIGAPGGLDDPPNASPKGGATWLVRKVFQTNGAPSRALCFVCGLGQYEMWIGGRRVGHDLLTPGWTDYAKTCLANCYDVTGLVGKGTNAIAIHVGNGMYDMSGDTRGGQQRNKIGPKKAICQIMLEYPNGSRQTVGTDGSWKWCPSPETYSGVFGGEDWDDRLEPLGWKGVGFDASAWKPVNLVSPPAGRLCGLSHSGPPIRVIDVRTPVSTKVLASLSEVVDLGQNAPYMPQIEVRGARGVRIRLWPGELLKANGSVDQQTMRLGKYCSYTLSGRGTEAWRPSFWYVGSQYWQIEATDSKGKPIDPHAVVTKFEGLLVHAAIPRSGTFACSNELFNRIYKLIWWAMCSNFSSVISDCPHREKSGWLEQDHLCGPSLMYAFDMRQIFRKVVGDIEDTQLPNGLVPTMAPEYFFYDGGFRDSVEWGASSVLLPQMLGSWYGQSSAVSGAYPCISRYLNYLSTKADGGILANGLGDWNGGGTDPRTPAGITDTAYYYLVAERVSEIAKGLGRREDSHRFGGLASSIRSAFNRKFFDPATGKVGTGSQSAQATALDLGLIAPGDQDRAFGALLQDIEKNNFAISCGEVGHPSLLRVLTRFGRSDVVAKIHLRTESPGYGYQLNRGRTTLAETWDDRPNSQNHFALGHLVEWLYGDLVGIQPDPEGPAFSEFVIKPHAVPEVSWASASYNSARGRIACSWRKTGARFHLEIEIPANTSAAVWIPSGLESPVRIYHRFSRSLSIAFGAGSSEGYQVIRLGSGRYSIDSVEGP